MQIKKDYTREQIVRVAKRVFLRKGFAKATASTFSKQNSSENEKYCSNNSEATQ